MTTTLVAQSADHPVNGAYTQPAPGVALSGVVQYRDTGASLQAGAANTGPDALEVITSVTIVTAGLYEISGTVSVTGTSVVAVESNNMGLYQGSTARIAAIPMPATTAGSPAVPYPTCVLNCAAADVISIKCVATATATAVYAASLVARQVN